MNFEVDQLLSPWVIIGVVCALVVLGLMIKNPRWGLVIIAAMAFSGSLATMGMETFAYGYTIETWLKPLQMARTELYLAAGCLLSLGVLLHLGKVNLTHVPVQGLLVLLTGIYSGVMTIAHPDAAGRRRAVGAFAIATTGSVILLVPGMINELEDWMWVLRAVMLAGIFWMFGCLVQVGINPDSLMLGNQRRFMGLSSNPQHAATMLAVLNGVGVWLWLNETHRRFRPLWLLMLAVGLVLQAWTGSRTGLLMLVVMLTAVFYSRFGRSILLLPVAGVAVVLVANLLEAAGINLGLERLTSTEDTRSMVWNRLLETALANPMTGVGTQSAGGSENSFLLAFAAFGVGAFLLMLLLVAVTLVQCARLIRAKAVVAPQFSKIADLCLGFFACYMLGANFEGFATARVSFMVVTFLLFSCMTSRLLEGALHQMNTMQQSTTGWLDDEAGAQAY